MRDDGGRGSKNVQNSVTSFIDDPLSQNGGSMASLNLVSDQLSLWTNFEQKTSKQLSLTTRLK